MKKKILASTLFIFSFFLSHKTSAQYQPVNASQLNIYNAWDNVVTSTDDGLYHQLIGTYRGWDKRAIYIAGYNSSIASEYATERVYIGNPNLNNKFLAVDLLSGKVGIGTMSPDEKLTVKGKIHTQEVKVDMAGPLVPDYVFANDYKLKTLQEVEEFIKKNNHLPEIPSAAEFEKDGIMLAEMNMSLLKKMEEMTLYMIEQNKKIIDLEKKMEKMKPVSK